MKTIKRKRRRVKPDPAWTSFTPGVPMPVGDDLIETWTNSRYQVIVYDLVREYGEAIPEGGWPRMVHLSIRRQDRDPIRDWRDMQRIKNELCGTTTEAIELYPSEKRLVDAANQYHLYVLEPGFTFPFGYDYRDVSDDDDWEAPDGSGDAEQRDFDRHHNATDCPEIGPVWRKRIDDEEE